MLGNSLEEGAEVSVKSLQIWFKSLYGEGLKNRGNSLSHAFFDVDNIHATASVNCEKFGFL